MQKIAIQASVWTEASYHPQEDNAEHTPKDSNNSKTVLAATDM